MKPNWTPQDIIDVMHGRHRRERFERAVEQMTTVLLFPDGSAMLVGLDEAMAACAEFPMAGQIDTDPNPYWRNHCRELH